MGTQLQYDFLVSIAEKIIYSPDNEFRLDLRELDALDFMFVSSACQNSFFFQFRRLKKVFLSNGGIELRSPVPIEGVNSPSDKRQFFQGPFNVNDWLFLFLLQRGVLRLRFVEIFYALSDSSPSEISFNHKGVVRSLKNEIPAESLARLLLFKGCVDYFKKVPLTDLWLADLKLDFVKVTDNAAVFAHLDRILNLNSEEVFVDSIGAFPEFKPVSIQKVKAARTKHFTLTYTVDINDPVTDTKDFPYLHLKSALTAITTSCPTLKRMYVRFRLSGEFSAEDFSILSNWLQITIKKLATETLGDFECRCELTVAFLAFFPESTLLEAKESAHELTQLGEKSVITSDDEAFVDEDGLSSTISGDDLPPSFTISRCLNVDERRMKKISYSLVGVQEDNTQDEWHGFNGPAVVHAAVADEWNGFDDDFDLDDFADLDI